MKSVQQKLLALTSHDKKVLQVVITDREAVACVLRVTWSAPPRVGMHNSC